MEIDSMVNELYGLTEEEIRISNVALSRFPAKRNPPTPTATYTNPVL